MIDSLDIVKFSLFLGFVGGYLNAAEQRRLDECASGQYFSADVRRYDGRRRTGGKVVVIFFFRSLYNFDGGVFAGGGETG